MTTKAQRIKRIEKLCRANPKAVARAISEAFDSACVADVYSGVEIAYIRVIGECCRDMHAELDSRDRLIRELAALADNPPAR